MELYDRIHENEELKTYILAGNRVLGEIGYTEHGLAHAGTVSKLSYEILSRLGYSDHECELAMVAGYMHDIGNMVNRYDHAQSGALMAFDILRSMEVNPKDIALIVGAIGHHDEKTAAPISPIAAALILADKSDVRRSRVRNSKTVTTDIHDRVNYAVFNSELEIDETEKVIILRLKIDNDICPVMEYFEIFLERMVLCKKSAARLGCSFELIINETRLL
ncbi:MAG: HD domain-containing protein [Clostridia bacterium]|nr:HD domain-containing protein [Clostridia bacterium]